MHHCTYQSLVTSWTVFFIMHATLSCLLLNHNLLRIRTRLEVVWYRLLTSEPGDSSLVSWMDKLIAKMRYHIFYLPKTCRWIYKSWASFLYIYKYYCLIALFNRIIKHANEDILSVYCQSWPSAQGINHKSGHFVFQNI